MDASSPFATVAVHQPSTPRIQPYGDGQKQIAPGGPTCGAQHQKVGVKQMVPGWCGGTWALAGIDTTTIETARRIKIDRIDIIGVLSYFRIEKRHLNY